MTDSRPASRQQPRRRKPCTNCGELVHSDDDHYVDAERVGCWWKCASVDEARRKIKALREQIAAAQKELDYWQKRRAIRMEAHRG